jgi:hypothetical protein
LNHCSEADRPFRAKPRIRAFPGPDSARKRGAATRATAIPVRYEVVPAAAPAVRPEFRSPALQVRLVAGSQGLAPAKLPIWSDRPKPERAGRDSKRRSGVAARATRDPGGIEVVPPADPRFRMESKLWGWQVRLPRQKAGCAACPSRARVKEAEKPDRKRLFVS